MHQREGCITFLRRKLSVTQYLKISLGNTSVYQKISDVETFYASERETERVGEYHVSPSKIFCLSVPIKFVGEHFCASKDFWYRFFESKEVEASRFCRKFFYLTGPKKLRQGTNLFQKSSGREKNFWLGGGGGYHDFPSKSFCLTVPKNFVGEHFGVSGHFGYRKILSIREGGCITFPVENFLSHSIKKSRWGTFRWVGKFRVSKNFMHQRGRGITFLRRKVFVTQYGKVSLGNTSVYREILGIEKFCASEREGVSHFSVENFLSHSIEKSRWGTLRCIGRFRLSKNFVHQRWKGYHISPSETFLSHSSEKFRWGTLRCIRRIRVSKNSMHERGRVYHISQSKTFCHTVPKNFLGEHFGVSEIFGYRNILCIRERERERERDREGWGVSRFSVENFLSPSSDKIRRRTLLCFERFLVSKF